MSSTDKLTREAILDRLRDIDDPVLGEDIVSLDIVKTVELKENTVRVLVALHAPFAPDEETIAAEIRDTLGDIDRNVELEVPPLERADAVEQPLPTVKNIVAVSSGKGGVGKSTVSVNIAVALAERGARVGVLDADLYGPNIPRMLGDGDPPALDDETQTLTPPKRHGVSVMSLGFLVPDRDAAVMRGPMIDSTLERLLMDVDWGTLDYLIVDLPPGTGDAQLTLCQTVPVTGAVVVTTPQLVSTDDAHRSLSMFGDHSIPVLGIVENMRAFTCPNCGDQHDLFGRGGGEAVAEEYDLPFLGAVPFDPTIRELADNGSLVPDDSDTADAFHEIATSVANGVGTLRRRGVSL